MPRIDRSLSLSLSLSVSPHFSSFSHLFFTSFLFHSSFPLFPLTPPHSLPLPSLPSPHHLTSHFASFSFIPFPSLPLSPLPLPLISPRPTWHPLSFPSDQFQANSAIGLPEGRHNFPLFIPEQNCSLEWPAVSCEESPRVCCG